MSADPDQSAEPAPTHQVVLIAGSGGADRVTGGDAVPSSGGRGGALDGGSDRVELTVATDQSILEAAEAAGLALPFGCRQGGCTSCAARLVSGELDQTRALALTDSMRDGGWVLLCVGSPLADTVIQVRGGGVAHRTVRGSPGRGW